MEEGHGRDEWSRLSVLLARMSDVHLLPKEPTDPAKLDPWRIKDAKTPPLPVAGIDQLTKVIMRPFTTKNA
jgi:hypothetical protein